MGEGKRVVLEKANKYVNMKGIYPSSPCESLYHSSRCGHYKQVSVEYPNMASTGTQHIIRKKTGRGVFYVLGSFANIRKCCAIKKPQKKKKSATGHGTYKNRRVVLLNYSNISSLRRRCPDKTSKLPKYPKRATLSRNVTFLQRQRSGKKKNYKKGRSAIYYSVVL